MASIKGATLNTVTAAAALGAPLVGCNRRIAAGIGQGHGVPGGRLDRILEAEGDTRIVSYQGGLNPTFGSAGGVIEQLPLDIFASANSVKRLVTSGLGGVFPPGTSGTAGTPGFVFRTS